MFTRYTTKESKASPLFVIVDGKDYKKRHSKYKM